MSPQQAHMNFGPNEVVEINKVYVRSNLERELAEVTELAIKEWQVDCREAFECGFFDKSQSEWVATKIAELMTRWREPRTDVIHREQIVELLEDLNNLANDYSSRQTGLPIHNGENVREKMIFMVVDRLNLTNFEDD